ncbi:MAG: LamG domain-containing protein [Rikenellaceae bacterium]
MKNIVLLLLFLTTIPPMAISSENNNYSIPGAIASYSFENNALDSSGENHGKVTKVDYKAGVVGQAASFDGKKSKIIISDKNGLPPQSITSLKKGTISVWIKFQNRGGQVLPILHLGKNSTAMPSRSMIFEIGHDRGNIENRRLYFTSIVSQGNNFCVDSGMDLEQDKWYHYVAVMNDTGSTIYLNGVEITTRRYNLNSTSKSVSFFDDIDPKEILSIGYGRYSQEEPFFSFNGLIDELLIFDRALSKEEVLELFSVAGLKMGDEELGYIDEQSMIGKSPIERSSNSKNKGNKNRQNSTQQRSYQQNRNQNYQNRGSYRQY